MTVLPKVPSSGRSHMFTRSLYHTSENWKQFRDVRGGGFYNMKAVLLICDIDTNEVYQRIVYAVGGDWRGGETH